MKLISLWQPWATFLALGRKRHETRSWSTTFRGRVAIHAARTSKGIDMCDGLSDAHPLGAIYREVRRQHHLPRGCIVALATIRDVVPTSAIRPAQSPEEIAVGDWADGRFAFALTDVVRLSRPVDFPGGQGLSIDLSPELSAVLEQDAARSEAVRAEIAAAQARPA